MSRSRKKTSAYTDYSRTGTKFAKRQASKAVRRYKGDISSGKWYRKVFNSWDIHDHLWLPSKEDGKWYIRGLRK